MGRPKTKFADLPPRMTARVGKRGLKRYYYGQQKISLGSCPLIAMHHWAQLEAGQPMDTTELLGSVELLKRAIPLSAVAGVYFLVADGCIKYVGKTGNLFKRLEEHRLRRKFDSYVWLPCAAAIVTILEGRYIAALRPEWNLTLKEEFLEHI